MQIQLTVSTQLSSTTFNKRVKFPNMVIKSKGQLTHRKTKVQWWNQSAAMSGENAEESVLRLSYFQVFTLYTARRRGYWGGLL